MKKIFAAIFLLLIFGASGSFGASLDVATKADIQILAGRIDSLGERLNDTNKRIDDVIANTNARFSDLRAEMNSGFAGVDREIDNLRHDIYWGLAALGLILGSPFYGPALKKFFAGLKAPAQIPREEIEKLIDAKLSERL